jgi:NADH:ubiquinone oxidoreductase subunit K
MVSLLIGILGIAMAGLYTGYLIYIRINRQSMMAKYKKHAGTPIYDELTNLFSTRRLIISSGVLLFFIATLVATLLNDRESKSIDGQTLAFFLILAAVVVIVTFIMIHSAFTEKGKSDTNSKH